MGQTAEKNRFYQEREKAALEYAGGHREVKNAVGARGFTITPGYADEILTDLELKVKRDLSNANFAILSEAVERELKQTGHDYDITIKNARIAWEIEKQGLLTALANELADHKKNLADSEDELDRRAIELALRESLLITAKTEINLELEGLKRQLQETDRLTWEKELSLINARKATAQAKLAVIPILEQIIAEEAKVLAQEEINIGYTQTLADAREELIGKKEELIPHVRAKAEKQIELATAILEEIGVREDRLAVSLQKTLTARDRTDAQVALTEADTELEALRLAMVNARNTLRRIEDVNRIALQDKRTTHINRIAAAESESNATILGYEEQAASYVRDVKKQISEIADDNDLEVATIGVNADLDSIKSIGSTRASEMRGKASISAGARVTSQLTHLLAG